MPISSVAVVGGGPAGCTIATAVAEAAIPARVVRATAGGLDLVERRLRRTLALRVQVGELSPEEAEEIAGRLIVTSDVGAVATCDLVLDATVGDARWRRALLATLESRMSRGAVLVSTAPPATLPELSGVLARPDQFLGMRLSHPATHARVAELTPLPETAPGALLAARILCGWLGKAPVERAAARPGPRSAPPRPVPGP